MGLGCMEGNNGPMAAQSSTVTSNLFMPAQCAGLGSLSSGKLQNALLRPCCFFRRAK